VVNDKTEIPKESDLQLWAKTLNECLQRFSDMDWHYSRIQLEVCTLKESLSPYVLGIEWVDTTGKSGRALLKAAIDEVTWGTRHSYELGILEIISLRLNQALSETTTDEYWSGVRPVIRLQKRLTLIEKGHIYAFWYKVQEVQGEEFENR
jgi:hypothetical protein